MEELKCRSLSLELQALRSLNTRIDLSIEARKHYSNLEKGYQGEIMFDQLTDKLDCDVLVIKDLCLEFNNTTFQIDTLIISQETIYPFEVKNYKGDFYYESESFKTLVSKNEILNPLDQLKRCIILLRQFLRSIGVHMPIKGYVVFINPEFTLYQTPLNAPIIYPTQLNHFMKTLNQTSSKLSSHHRKLAAQLISMHKTISPYKQLPSYTFGQLKKGILYPVCHSFVVSRGERKVFCEKCDCGEDTDTAILRSVEELKLLFPDMKITTNCVYEWCGGIGSQKKIRRLLKENYKMIGVRQWTYFE